MPATAESRSQFFARRRERELLGRFDPADPPAHVAIIMDGNGRWATKRGLPRIAGHRAGVKAIRETIAAAIELGVGALTLYSFSSENWRRPAAEVSGLMQLFVEVLERELANLDRMGVRVRVIGRLEGLPEATAEAFHRAEEATADNTALVLAVALNYGGRGEILDAARSLARAARDGALVPEAISESDLEAHLYTAGMPDPDLLVRTSGEFRLSNFLLWQVAYAEIWVTGKLWPDFDRYDLLRAIVDFQARERRFGGSS